ncbi:hypothetical protein D1013_18255 [Euzebyella marina]|uniref:DUF4142 domain-containing protein n=1 Tax=Euzebyella marina TaxID=1761453 RepID=A0A3G2LAC0_9FLAO|nr:hypothetical protein [Euzebyella marina]AYN69189.1 hypothetical protein D1013_18255 [Euzebyella marina]
MKSIFASLSILFLLVSCNQPSAENYFDRTTLNSNKLVGFGSADFDRYAQLQETGQLFKLTNGEMEKTDKISEHITTYIIPDIEKNIEQIEELKPTEETEEMIVKSLRLFNYVKNIYETEYLTIANMMDNGEEVDEINEALSLMNSVTFTKFSVLLEELWEVALPYAEANGIEVKTY